MSGTSWLLGAGYSWQSGDPDRLERASRSIVANDRRGLSLAPVVEGRWGLLSPGDTLGGLSLPRGVAVDGTRVFVLSNAGDRVFRYDPIRVTLVPLAEIGFEGLDRAAPSAHSREPRRFVGASNIAATRGRLYVADPSAQRVQVFDQDTLALVRIHSGLTDPADVAAGASGVYVLDRGTGRVYLAEPDRDDLVLVVRGGYRRGRWDRLAVDRDGRIYLRDGAAEPPALDVFAPAHGRRGYGHVGRLASPDEARDRFVAPAIEVDASGDLILSDHLLDPCGLRRRWGAAATWRQSGDRLYVIDSESQTVRVHLLDGRVRHHFGPFDGEGRLVPPAVADAWRLTGLVVVDGCGFVLDEKHQRVYRHRTGDDLLGHAFDAPVDHPRRWRRIAEDGRGCLLLWDGSGEIDHIDQQGRVIGQLPATKVAARFDVEEAPAQPVDRTAAVRLARDGATPVAGKVQPRWPGAGFERAGVWTSQWLDSGVYNCQWHVVEVNIHALPPGGRVKVRTRTSAAAQSADEVQSSVGTVGALGSWRDVQPLDGPPQPSADELKPRTVDFVVPSGPGQFIQLQIALSGDGVRTPLIESVRLRFPRESLLQYLPAIYSRPEEQREFLDRFLSIAQTTWTAVERDVDGFERFLDPDSVPPDAMGYLASWLDLRLEGSWSAQQNRRLLQALPSLWRKWGTVEGIRGWVRIYLSSLAGIDVDDLERAGIPGVVERFVERRHLMLSRGDTARLGGVEALWSPSVERRFQVGVFDREGEVELVSTGEPALDVFRRYAHGFRVFVPAAWVRSANDEGLVRRAIEMQKPAHTTYELVLTEPRFLVGQSTLDLDTVIGAPRHGELACATDDVAPSQTPRGRLGFDTLLAGGSGGRHGGAGHVLD